MNAALLLEHYTRIADLPHTIDRIRRFTLDLAVRGKLVEQDPNEEPAGDLLKRIAAEKARLVKAGAARKPKPISEHDDPPYALPIGWTWSQIAEIGIINPRVDADDDTQASFVPMPLIAAEYGVPNKHEVREWRQIKKGYTHFAEGDVGLAKITPCFENGKSTVFRNLTGAIGSGTTELHIVRPIYVDPAYILIFLKSPSFIEKGIPKMTGTAGQKRVPTDYFATTPFPLPPLAEQQRIVAKVDELMALCEQLERARAEREDGRDKLTAASLARLNAPDLDTFQDDVHFALENLDPLTARIGQIEELRQTIRSLAVRGKLVEQNPQDEPASKLAERIAAEKARLVKKGTIRSQKPAASISPSEHPYVIPSGWVWDRLSTVAIVTQGFAFASSDFSKSPNDGYPLIKIGDIGGDQPGTYIKGNPDLKFLVRPGEILLGLSGSIKTAIWAGPMALLNQRIAKISSPSSDLLTSWLYLAVEAQIEKWKAETSKLMVQNIKADQLSNAFIPVPPAAEQRRIVAKVNELMALCDQLEASLVATQKSRSMLLEAVLHHALVPA